MDERTKQENDALRGMFETDGWAVLMRNTKERLEAFRTAFPFNVDTVEQLYFTRGVISTLTVLTTLEAQLEAAEAAALEAEANKDLPPEDA